MAEEEAEAESAEEEEKKKGGIKGIVIKVVPLLLVGFLAAKMTVLKPPPPTQDELDAAKKTEMLETWTMCAHENEQPFDEDAAEVEIEAIIKEENELHGMGEEHSDEESDDDHEADPESGDEDAPAEDEEAPAEEEGESLRPPGGGLGVKVASARPATSGGGGATSSLPPVYENDAVTLNLADGHYVKIKIALQLAAAVDVEALGVANYGSKAQDMVNSRLRALTVDQLVSPDTVTALKYELGNQICREYHGEVTSIYFAEFVTQ